MLYVGVQDQYYTYTMFDVQALWALKYVLGDIKIPDKETMISSWKGWVDRWAIKGKKERMSKICDQDRYHNKKGMAILRPFLVMFLQTTINIFQDK